MAFALPAISAAANVAAAQVMIAPPTVFMADNERVTSISVRNFSDSPQEVSVALRFGYPRSDSLGNLFMVYDDTTLAARHSMAAWLRAYPRQFVLQPGGEQIVRLVAQPPSNLPAGVYWTRLVTASQPQSPPMDDTLDAVGTRIVFRVEQITTALYRRGAPTTGIDIGSPVFATDTGGSYMMVPLTRTGTAPFLGSVALRIRDRLGNVVHETRRPVSVYVDGLYRFTLPPAAQRSREPYGAELSVVAERPDIPRRRLLPVAPLTLGVEYTPP